MSSTLEVITPAPTGDLTTLETVKAELGITGDEHDAFLSRKIAEVSENMARYRGYPFGRQTYRETFRIDRSAAVLILSRRWGGIQIDSVTADGTVLQATQYELDNDAGLLYRLESDSQVAWRARKVVVKYQAGFVLLTTLPRDLEEACIGMVVAAYHAKGRDPALRSIDVPDVVRTDFWGGASVQKQGGLPADVAAVVDRYRDITVG